MENLQIPAETAKHTPTVQLMKQLDTTGQGLSADEAQRTWPHYHGGVHP